MEITPSALISDLEDLEKEVNVLREIPVSILIKSPEPGKWSVLEVIEHMNLTMRLYEPKISESFIKMKKLDQSWSSIKARRSAAMFIKGLAPQDGEIKYKMPTSKIFKPTLESSEVKIGQDKVFDEFKRYMNILKDAAGRMDDYNVRKHRFNSALGALVRFNLAEAIAFMIAHNQRHLQQIRNTLDIVSADPINV